MSTAERNREIKKALEAKYGRGKVRVRGDRGTAYGWVTVHIDVTPIDMEEQRALTARVWEALDAAKLSQAIGTYGYDDPGSDYGFGREISIQFNTPTYAQTMRHSDGSVSARKHYSEEWEMVLNADGDVVLS